MFENGMFMDGKVVCSGKFFVKPFGVLEKQRACQENV